MIPLFDVWAFKKRSFLINDDTFYDKFVKGNGVVVIHFSSVEPLIFLRNLCSLENSWQYRHTARVAAAITRNWMITSKHSNCACNKDFLSWQRGRALTMAQAFGFGHCNGNRYITIKCLMSSFIYLTMCHCRCLTIEIITQRQNDTKTGVDIFHTMRFTKSLKQELATCVTDESTKFN